MNTLILMISNSFNFPCYTTYDPFIIIFSFKMPCVNTSWTGPHVAKSLVTPCTDKPQGRSPEILVAPYAGFWGPHRSLSPADLHTYQAHEPRDQHGRPQAGAHPPPPTRHPKPQVRESRAQPPKLGRVNVLIHFSQTCNNVMRNWCRPVAQPSPSWRRYVGFWGPIYYRIM